MTALCVMRYARRTNCENKSSCLNLVVSKLKYLFEFLIFDNRQNEENITKLNKFAKKLKAKYANMKDNYDGTMEEQFIHAVLRRQMW